MTDLRFDYSRRIFYFLIIALGCLLIAAMVMGMILPADGPATARQLRVATVVQDVVAFIIPALVTALMVTPLPATFLGVDRRFSMPQLLIAIAVMISSIPAMNIIIEWNAHLPLPEWAGGIEQYMRQAEDRAAESVRLMLSGNGTASLILSVMIVGVLAALSEELFFRGALQNLISSGPLGIHTSIWLTAIIFSLFHMQFYGFVPRVLLGAYFGYLLWWSRSLWLPIIIHALNNSVYVVTARQQATEINTFGVGDIWLGIGSVILTAILIWRLYKVKEY